MPSPAAATLAVHPLDRVSLGKIVQIRETLLRAQAKGARVIRFESGDPSFAVASHVLSAIADAGAAGKTHYVPNDGIPELRRALAEKLGIKTTFTAVDFATVLPSISAGRFDLGVAGYFGLMGCAAAMAGNSSSALIEAPSFGLPAVNIGERQDGRVRGANVIDCPNDAGAIAAALGKALDPAFRRSIAEAGNPYRGKHAAAPQIIDGLAKAPRGRDLLNKRFVDRP